MTMDPRGSQITANAPFRCRVLTAGRLCTCGEQEVQGSSLCFRCEPQTALKINCVLKKGTVTLQLVFSIQSEVIWLGKVPMNDHLCKEIITITLCSVFTHCFKEKWREAVWVHTVGTFLKLAQNFCLYKFLLLGTSHYIQVFHTCYMYSTV